MSGDSIPNLVQFIEGCPFGGAHRISPWSTKLGPPGVSCNRCHKTWWLRDNLLVPVLGEAPDGAR